MSLIFSFLVVVEVLIYSIIYSKRISLRSKIRDGQICCNCKDEIGNNLDQITLCLRCRRNLGIKSLKYRMNFQKILTFLCSRRIDELYMILLCFSIIWNLLSIFLKIGNIGSFFNFLAFTVLLIQYILMSESKVKYNRKRIEEK